MGDLAQSEPEADIEILVTGYGAFNDIHQNPAFMIAESLPTRLPLPTGQSITLHTYPDPIPVVYRDVLDLLPKLYKQHPNVKYFIHIGTHRQNFSYRLEERARKGPYRNEDVNDQTFEPQPGPERDLWDTFPEVLWTGVDADAIAEGMPADKEGEVVTSKDAGLYLCEFIFYYSLLIAKQEQRANHDLDGLFFHCPRGTSEYDIGKGREILIHVIREMVMQRGQ